jgi:hypothetical protein
MTSPENAYSNNGWQQVFIGIDDVVYMPVAPTVSAGSLHNANYVWSTTTLTWVKETQPGQEPGGNPGVANAAVTASVTNSDSVVLAANALRTSAVIVNVGKTDWAYFGDGTAAQSNYGIALSPNGGTWVMDQYTFTVNAIHAISPTSTTLSIQEYQT